MMDSVSRPSAFNAHGPCSCPRLKSTSQVEKCMHTWVKSIHNYSETDAETLSLLRRKERHHCTVPEGFHQLEMQGGYQNKYILYNYSFGGNIGHYHHQLLIMSPIFISRLVYGSVMAIRALGIGLSNQASKSAVGEGRLNALARTMY
ncbi:uncharacterized protein BDCG_16847 [Blastomyces dermatitidis ER-3]|uniref:Uncharacterized protein n=2 Tax=Ajellomyces dermatitidis TaxID=5039 RepID=A0A0J9ENY3_AJEDA|nr:uncharacterized protein BDCG_16847 [Blastomyces dermatitidis ER-3]EQL32724.1 hypothetical protein BDFG_05115 [Blastomyces dermatitidis ATCC 26199]KMW67747.1 hypothetical protein BDDG_12293 [Blastomyces dermatitidis ATCC 18188]OAT01015.1 hypothetical protein BDCG_16847 [Blastomyces dermatitidis ER-3]